MNEYSIALRVWHPSRDAIEIAEALRLMPTFSQSARMPRVTRSGKPLGGTYRETYCCFYFAPATSLAASLDAVVKLLRHHAADIGRWRVEDGRVNIALDGGGPDHAPFHLSAAVLRAFGQMGVGIEISSYRQVQRHGERHYNEVL